MPLKLSKVFLFSFVIFAILSGIIGSTASELIEFPTVALKVAMVSTVLWIPFWIPVRHWVKWTQANSPDHFSKQFLNGVVFLSGISFIFGLILFANFYFDTSAGRTEDVVITGHSSIAQYDSKKNYTGTKYSVHFESSIGLDTFEVSKKDWESSPEGKARIEFKFHEGFFGFRWLKRNYKILN